MNTNIHESAFARRLSGSAFNFSHSCSFVAKILCLVYCASKVLSSPELPQVMVAMQIAPAHPFGLGHVAEERVRTKLDIFRRRGEAFDQRYELSLVALEIIGRSSADLLINFRPRLDSPRPRQRRVKRDPFHYRARKRVADRRNLFLAKREFKRVAQMADHLMRRHLTPPPPAVRPKIA